ncbi:Uu.00g145390.m01.CDS01 [Anthostomella pinea]|uniref:Uu.00g145390.m01.CDS01 n=1 Tax=Anthostomella pinea TaxID=933095 RepID=A0AAI8YLQ9_9PEZI|nr:Uu.00g145390.m01.CDS01 [Anthostomella pinea]
MNGIAAVHPPAWRAYVHLYLPLLTTILIFLTVPDPFGHRLPILLAGIPTYFLGSFVYPSNRPAPSPAQLVRFTRKGHLYRAGVLFTYGRILGSPFNPLFFVGDLALNYGAGYVIGERGVGEPQRRSEFAVHALWALGSGIAMNSVPPRWGMLRNLVGTVDRTLWRAAWLALFDDIVGILAYPDLETRKGKAVVVCVQGAVILVVVCFTRYRLALGGAQGMRQHAKEQVEADQVPT